MIVKCLSVVFGIKLLSLIIASRCALMAASLAAFERPRLGPSNTVRFFEFTFFFIEF